MDARAAVKPLFGACAEALGGIGFPCNWVHGKRDSDLVSFRIDAPCFCHAGLMGGREHDSLHLIYQKDTGPSCFLVVLLYSTLLYLLREEREGMR